MNLVLRHDQSNSIHGGDLIETIPFYSIPLPHYEPWPDYKNEKCGMLIRARCDTPGYVKNKKKIPMAALLMRRSASAIGAIRLPAAASARSINILNGAQNQTNQNKPK